MSVYIDRDMLYRLAHNHIDGAIDCNDIIMTWRNEND